MTILLQIQNHAFVAVEFSGQSRRKVFEFPAATTIGEAKDIIEAVNVLLEGLPSQVPTVAQVMDNPGTTFWLARALSSADTRDPVDALRDAELLTAVLRAKLANIQGRPL